MERRRRRPRERWLLTRKTWKYMADAGRRLVPDGAQNRAEDVPRIEAYFQKVCAGEPRFLLWRKSSYPGALPKPRKKRRPRSASVRGREPGDAPPPRPADLMLHHTSGGRFDIAKLRRDFFNAPPPPSPTPSGSGFVARFSTAGPSEPLAPAGPTEEEDDSTLVDLLRKYLKLEELEGPGRLSESDELVRALKRYLRRQADRTPADGDDESSRRTLQENLGRYYGRSPNRDHIVQDLLTDRNLLKRLYHDLRKAKPYRGGRVGGSAFGPGFSGAGMGRVIPRTRTVPRGLDEAGDWALSPPMSPPPLIEVCGESLEEEVGKEYAERGTQTLPVCEAVLQDLEREYRARQEALSPPTSPSSPPSERRPGRRRSSVDHDDVSQSVSDTIKRYLRMARKKSVDADKADRFKRINYDKNLRNIKPRPVSDVDDDGPHKGCQTEENWISGYRESAETTTASVSVASSPPTSPPSPVSPTGHHSFLQTLLGRSAPAVAPPAGGMQKSRSSSSVVHSVGKRLFRTRSRSSSRAAPTWSPQGSCCWSDGSGRCVRLADVSLLTLTDVERRALQQAALARLQQLNLGTTVKIPDENAVIVKPKRRAHLLKRKALTTGFFDQSRKDADKDKECPNGVFGVPLSQCVAAERALRRQHGGSRASLASLSDNKGDDSESCDSGDWSLPGVPGLDDAGGGGPKVPGLVAACLAHLRRNLRTLGLFRVSASKKRVRELREEWERGDVGVLDNAAPHDVATLLKEFLRDLPDPLLCRDLYSAFLHTQKIRNRRLQWEAMRLLVQLLPAAHRDTLNALLQFLSQLAAHSEDDHQPGNKMDAANIATIFAPNILHKNKPNENASSEQLAERTDVINVVRLLIERQSELWTLSADLLHEAYIHLAHTEPATLHALLLRRAESTGDSLVSREQLLHAAAAVNSEQPAVTRRTRGGSGAGGAGGAGRDGASDTSSESASAMTVVTRMISGVSGSSGVCRDHDDDSATEYPESTLGGSDDDCVITASLHIPAAFPPQRPAAPPRRRSSGSDASAHRDSAVGSSSADCSPPASPRAARHHADIDTLLALGRERNTSDARAVMLRQHDESATRHMHTRRQEHTHVRKHDAIARMDEPSTRREERRDGVTLYKRGELISSARSPT